MSFEGRTNVKINMVQEAREQRKCGKGDDVIITWLS